MKDVIIIKNLEKSFGEVKAIQDISFNVKAGELFAFLGINGAGKSTTINIICGQLKKDNGHVEVNEMNIEENLDSIKKDLGVVFQSSLLDDGLNVYDNLESRAALYDITGRDFKNRLSELNDLLHIENLLKRKVGKLSGGERRRIDIARALLHKPKILILDEPTTGLDPKTRKLIWSVIDDLIKKQNMTVFLTTHYMEEASNANFVVIIDSGKIVASATPLELKEKYANDYISLYNISEEEVKKVNIPYQKTNNGYRISIENTEIATNLILKYPNLFKDYEISKGNMDDVFLNITGKNLSEM